MALTQLSVLCFTACSQRISYSYKILAPPFFKKNWCFNWRIYSFRSMSSFCFLAGLLTCCPGTGPGPPSSLSLAAARSPARPTCSAESIPFFTPKLPTTSGQRMLTCVWTMPWNTVSAYVFRHLKLTLTREDSKMTLLFLSAGKHHHFFKTGDIAIIVTGWRPGAGYTNTMRVVLVPWTSSKDISNFPRSCNLPPR